MRKIDSIHDVMRSFETSLMNKELLLRYQPIINTETNSVVSMEALLHWPDMHHFDTSPEQIFNMVEQDENLSRLVDRHLISVAVGDLSKFISDLGYTGSVSVNTCPSTLADSSFYEFFSTLLDQFGIKMNRIVIEITERNIWEDRDQVLHNINLLKEGGIRIAIDDFITGYANFGTLLNKSTDIIKLDRCVTHSIPGDPICCKFCHSFIDLAKQVEKQVIVEGVETEEQLQFFKANGYTLFQGFLLSKPLLKDEIGKFLIPSNS